MSKPDHVQPLSVLLLNQAFYPDVASTAQHLSGLAAALCERGHRVTALASARSYDNPNQTYAAHEVWKGVEIYRIQATGFGKSAKWRRAIDFATYLANCALRLLTMARHDVVVALTTPPLISFLGALMVRLKGGRLVFWVMDLNPDEAIAAGWLDPDSITARILQKMLRYSLHSADSVIALDRFMAERLGNKQIEPSRIAVLAPWSHNQNVYFDRPGRDTFRARNGLTGKFVVMYSGNHSPCHSLETLLRAAKELQDDSAVHFAFVGGGSEFRHVQRFAAEHQLTNVLTLPYQPLEHLAASLSSADLHTVVMGDAFVGMVHPCKIYNILALGTPALYIGPEHSHIGDLIARYGQPSWLRGARHGDVEQVVRHIRTAHAEWRLEIPEEAAAADEFSERSLLLPHIAAVERAGRAGVSKFSTSIAALNRHAGNETGESQ